MYISRCKTAFYCIQKLAKEERSNKQLVEAGTRTRIRIGESVFINSRTKIKHCVSNPSDD